MSDTLYSSAVVRFDWYHKTVIANGYEFILD